DDVEQLTFVAQSLAAATLRAGADTVLQNPALFFNTDATQTKFVGEVGKAFVDLFIPVAATGDAKFNLNGVSPEGLETLLRATLAAVGNNPGILQLDGETEKRLTPLLADLATTFSKAELPDSAKAAFAESAAIVIAATGRNLDTLWPGSN